MFTCSNGTTNLKKNSCFSKTFTSILHYHCLSQKSKTWEFNRWKLKCCPEGGYRYSSTLPGTRRGRVVSSTPRPHFIPGKDPVPILQEAGWAPGLVWTGAENLVPARIWSWPIQPLVSRYTDWATWPTGVQQVTYGMSWKTSVWKFWRTLTGWTLCLKNVLLKI